MTYFAKNNIPYGDQVESAEILEEGIPTIKKLGEYLKDIKTEVNYTSPFKRCIQTSGIVSEITNKKFEVDGKLRDWDPRHETVEEMIERLLSFCRNIENTNHNSLSICTHGYPINALIAYFTKREIKVEDLDNYPNPGVLTMIAEGKVNYKDFN